MMSLFAVSGMRRNDEWNEEFYFEMLLPLGMIYLYGPNREGQNAPNGAYTITQSISCHFLPWQQDAENYQLQFFWNGIVECGMGCVHYYSRLS